MSDAFRQVIASYHRARRSGEMFDTLYELFLSKSPDIPPLFAFTDFPHQKLMLRQSLLEMLVFYQTGEGHEEIERLGRRHWQVHVKPEHYGLWLDALCETLARHDPKFTSELGQMWRAAMQRGIDVMLAVSHDETRS